MRQVVMLLCCMVAGTLLHAQSGEVTGRTLDNYDSGLAKAKIVVVDSLGNAIKGMSTTSDFAGDYKLKKLSPGTYDLQVTLKNYHTKIAKGVLVYAGKTTFLNFRLNPATNIGKQ